MQKIKNLCSSLLHMRAQIAAMLAIVLVMSGIGFASGQSFRQIINEQFTQKVLSSNADKSQFAGYATDFLKSDGKHRIDDAGTVVDYIDSTSTKVYQNGAHGQQAVIESAETTITGMSGATVTATNLIPAGSIVLGVTVRVTTTITGASAFTVGDGSDADRWGSGIALTSGTKTTLANITITSLPVYASATSVVLTATTSNFTAGAVRVTVHYMKLVGATS